MAKLRPLHDQLIVKAIADEQATKAGIILAQTAEKQRSEKGEVIAVGPGKVTDSGKRQEMSVKIGDKIIFKKYAPDQVKVEEQEYLIIAESDVLAVIE
jgi:chaperonin GroES